MTLRNVPKGYTLEQQRQEINLVAADLNTAIDGVQTFGGNKEFTGEVNFTNDVTLSSTSGDVIVGSIDNPTPSFSIYAGVSPGTINYFTFSAGSNESYIRNVDGTGGGGSINIQGRSGASLWTGTSLLAVAADSNGAGVLYYQSLKKLEATTSGVTVTGSVLVDSNLYVNSGYPGTGAQILETGAYRARVDDVATVVQDALVLGRFQNLDSFVVKANGDVSTIGVITAASFVGPITGNADTATALETARNIAGQSFDGTTDITIAATDLSDTDQSLATTSDVTFNSIAKSGGTSVEFLKADGTVDSNTYLITETDPVFSASEAASITSTDTTNWDTAYGWGDHSVEGYLTSYTETDPVVGAITGIVKADGAGNISAAVAGTDYATAAQGALADTALQSETITLATLKAEVAAATDFADFQSRIAAL